MSLAAAETVSAKTDSISCAKGALPFDKGEVITAIVTIPPYAPFIEHVARHPVVSGLRLNTVMPVKSTDTLESLLSRLQTQVHGRDVWIDLKGRQLRTTGYATPPFTEVMISHEISVETPCTAYFGNGRERATLTAIDGKRLLFLEGPKRVVGPGESINLPYESLRIKESLTDIDKAYIAAAKAVGLHQYMLSFVETQEDIAELTALDSQAVVVAKIESMKGIDYVRATSCETRGCRLMAARGDLYVEVTRPHEILNALETIIAKDGSAIAASRILSGMANSAEPDCAEITDIAYLLRCGYRTLMLGDEVCLQKESVLGALNVLYAIRENYEGRKL